MERKRSRSPQSFWICTALAALTLAAYWPVLRCGFINLDDPDYVTANRHVRNGLTWRGFSWAHASTHAANWHPLTRRSHMVDCQIFRPNARGHHLVNLLLHLANTLLLFSRCI